MVPDIEAVRKLMQLEIDYLPKLKHPNIIELFGYTQTSNQGCLIYPYFKNGTLRQRMDMTNSPLSAEQRLKIMMGMARGLHHIHVYHLTWVNST